MLIADQYFDMLRAYINHLIDDFAICQALADPRKSQALTEFGQEIVRREISSLNNDVIQMQRDEIATLRSEICRLQRERMDTINDHAAEIKGLHGKYAQIINGLNSEYTQKIKDTLAIPAETK
jgi:hypothetical protein